ncbi:hypothetical protein [Actinophytocola sediminis]
MSADLLGELATLRARTRADRRAYAFPLILFGVLILLSPLVYVSRHWSREELARGILVDQGPFPQFFPMSGSFIRYPELVGWYVGTFLATVAFGAIGVYLIGGYAAFVAIGVALVVLAWRERSALLLAISLVFLLVSVPANHPIHQWDITAIYGVDGWDSQQVAFFSVLAPGVVLLVGGALAVIGNRR